MTLRTDGTVGPPVTEEATSVDYDDDIALVVAAKYLEDAHLYSCEAITWF